MAGEAEGPRVELGRERSVLRSELPPPLVACVSLIDFMNARGDFVIDTSLQQLVVATVVRSFDTFKPITSTLFDGPSTQAAMLCRPLFEDMVVAHWVVLNEDDPDWLIQRFHDHRDTMALYQDRLARDTNWRFGDPIVDDLGPVNARQNELFKAFGGEAQDDWWDPGSDGRGKRPQIGLRRVAEKLEQAAERHERFEPRFAGGAEPLLMRMELVAHKWFNQCLHHTALGLPIQIVEPGAMPGVVGDQSVLVAFAAWWVFSQQLYLLHDLYGTSPDHLNEIVRGGFVEVFGAKATDIREWPP